MLSRQTMTVVFFMVAWMAALVGCGGKAASSTPPAADVPDDTAPGAVPQDMSTDPSVAPPMPDGIPPPGETPSNDEEHLPPGGGVPDLSHCPASEPEDQSPCAPDGLVCTYGGAPRAECRSRADCPSGQWKIQSGTCVEPPEDYCVAIQPGDACVPLALDGSEAPYGNGQIACVTADNAYCNCVYCPQDCQSGYAWECMPPPDPASCPPLLPNIGAPCETQGVTCAYGDACHGGGTRVCRNGVWYPRSVSCPETP